MIRPVLWTVAVVVAFVAVALASVWRSGTADAATFTVAAQNYFFSPATLTINAGDTVTWTNSSGVEHTATSDSGVWNGSLPQGGSFSFTFANPGVFNYFCAFHSSLGMVGTITVNPASGGPTPTALPTATQPGTSTIGGRGLTLGTGSVDLTWLGGTLQTGYSILRLSLTSGFSTPTGGASVSANAVSFSDNDALPDPVYCYAVFAQGASGVLGNSDALCLFPNTGGGTSAAAQFRVQLNQSTTTTLRWTAPGGATSLVLFAQPMNGAPLRRVDLAANTTTATDDTSGIPTCYAVATLSGTNVTGVTKTLCVWPGRSNLGG